MEYRNWQRRRIPLEVEVSLWHRGGEQTVVCKTHDVSMNGALLLTHELGYPKHRLLEIRFKALSHLQLKQPRIIARAIRKNPNGIAVRFRKADRDTIRALHKMLQWRNYFPLAERKVDTANQLQRRYLKAIPPAKA
jgi:hypothetical protein